MRKRKRTRRVERGKRSSSTAKKTKRSTSLAKIRKAMPACRSCGKRLVKLEKNVGRARLNVRCTSCPAMYRLDDETKQVVVYKPGRSIIVKVVRKR